MKKFWIPTLFIVAGLAIVSLATNYEWPRQATQSQKIGFGATIDSTSTGSVAISSCDGHSAVAGAIEACQIGTGSNTTDYSFKYRDRFIMDGDKGLGIRLYGAMQLKYIFWQDDFIEGGYVANGAVTNVGGLAIPGSKFSEQANRGAWLVSVVDGDSDGGETIVVGDAGHGGILEITTNNKALDSVEAQMNGESFQIQVGEEAWFNARWSSEDVDQNTNVIGLALSDTDTIASLPNDHIVFMNQASNLYFSVGQNGTATSFDTGVNLADGVMVTTAWYWDGVSTISVVVNGTVISNVVDNGTTVLFPDDQAISPVMAIQTTDTGADTMKVDYIGCYLER